MLVCAALYLVGKPSSHVLNETLFVCVTVFLSKALHFILVLCLPALSGLAHHYIRKSRNSEG